MEQERDYLLENRLHDEFWYAEQFNLNWPLAGDDSEGDEEEEDEEEGTPFPEAPQPSPSPSPSASRRGFVTAGIPAGEARS